MSDALQRSLSLPPQYRYSLRYRRTPFALGEAGAAAEVAVAVGEVGEVVAVGEGVVAPVVLEVGEAEVVVGVVKPGCWSVLDTPKRNHKN
jgi:hypothetical protein